MAGKSICGFRHIIETCAKRARDEYVKDEIFPRDGDASDAAVQALIEVSALIRAVPNRVKSSGRGLHQPKLA